jgi:hypothetical protein
MLFGLAIGGISGAVLLGSFIFFPALIALGIDYIRLNTSWHPILKLIVSIPIFLIGFIVMVTAIAVMDASGLFK